jgi:hypothetical protein
MQSIRIAAFDIGIRNFAFVVDDMPLSYLQHIAAPRKRDRYNKDGTCTQGFGSILDQICTCGELVEMANISLSTSKNLDRTAFDKMTNVLDSYSHLWDGCSAILVEQQMSFGKRLNITALKLGQHCYSYFSITYPFKTVVEFPAYHKTQVLGAPKKMTKPERKKWAVARAEKILYERCDLAHLEKLAKLSKRDDISDCLLHIIAYVVINFIY